MRITRAEDGETFEVSATLYDIEQCVGLSQVVLKFRGVNTFRTGTAL